MNKMDYDKIMSDRKLFNETVYTPLTEAIQILEERQKDSKLREKIEELLDNNIPEPLRKIDKYGISGKQLATPNLDTRWFIKLVKQFNLKALFLEYLEDKFISKNEFKHSLGQLIIHKDFNKKGEYQEEKVTIVDFNTYDGRKIKDVVTKWGEPLVDFHRKLFEAYSLNKKDFVFYDESSWLEENGKTANNYYKRDLLLYVYHGILFENFNLTGDSGKFTREILLPAFAHVEQLTGLKPLITPIPPMDIEDDLHWLSFDDKIKPYIGKI
ncbi:MAG: hypothetical protein QG644_505 [Patescibacteria group bacterium]|nr:hypothetical protein [Patescibacteria group bacterium]